MCKRCRQSESCAQSDAALARLCASISARECQLVSIPIAPAIRIQNATVNDSTKPALVAANVTLKCGHTVKLSADQAAVFR